MTTETNSDLHRELHTLRESVTRVDGKVDELRASLTKLADAITSVVRLEVRHESTLEHISALRQRLDEIDARLDTIERQMPQLLETRAWIVRWLLTVMGIVGAGVLALVVKLP